MANLLQVVILFSYLSLSVDISGFRCSFQVVCQSALSLVINAYTDLCLDLGERRCGLMLSSPKFRYDFLTQEMTF